MSAESRTLSRIDILAGLTPAELDRFISGCRVVKVATNDHVFHEGDTGDEVFVVRTGRVRIAKAISLDSRRTLAMVGPGGIFGELAMVDAGPRSASAEALETSEVLALAREPFETLVREEPALGAKILGRFAATLAERLRITNDLLRDTVAWGLDVSGAAALNLEGIVHLQPLVDVRLTSGQEVVGQLLKVDQHAHGIDLLVREGRDERLYLLPYHAVVSIAFPGDHAAVQHSAEG